MTAHPLLLEVGVEELPSSFVDAALAALPALVSARLGELRLLHGEVKALGTPRRLAVIVKDVALQQTDLDEEVLGPPESAGFKDGKPTKAAEAFALKLGIQVSEIKVEDKAAAGKQKAGRYLVGRRVEKGRPARELLGAALVAVCEKVPFKKSMRWGASDFAFGRPVQWLVALFGEEALDITFAGVRSGRASRGHRFLSAGDVLITSAQTYVEQLRAAHVVVDREERARVMMEKVAAAALAAGGMHDPEPSLVDDNASLVEEPHVVTGSFDPAFLELPATVIRAVARGHQKYFCVQKSDNHLVPHYITVVNTAQVPANIVRGNDRVMRARLSDARFFVEEDKKAKLEDRVEKLGGIVFHNRLGTVRDKVARLEKLARAIAARVDEDTATCVRAAHLCKSDLPSLMVGEFPELQGHMGRAYAIHHKETQEVADAVRDHYRPTGAHDAVAPLGPAAVVALADRLDSLTGCFAVGLSPTGAADPFALRRACIATLRTLMEHGGASPKWAELSFVGLAKDAYEGLASGGKKLDLDADATAAKIAEFGAERLRGLLAGISSGPVADAILGSYAFVGDAKHPVVAYPAYAAWKARALQKAVDGKEAWIGNARTVTKRLAGISKAAEPRFHGMGTLGATPADAAKNGLIVKLVETVDAATKDLAGASKVETAIRSMREVAEGLEKVFTEMLVNDPADPLTPKRLELLSYGAACMLRIADFSRLA